MFTLRSKLKKGYKMTRTTTEPATYYDYTDLTVEEWAESLKNSEVHNYKFNAINEAYHQISGVTYFKEYNNGQVLTYEVR